jgi:cytosine deaminase
MDHPLPQRISTLRGARLPDGSVVDLELGHDGEHALVTSVGPSAPHRYDDNSPRSLDLSGYVLLTAPAEPHAHLDKALSWDVLAPPVGDLGAAI